MNAAEVLRLIASLATIAADAAEGKPTAVDEAAATLHKIANELGLQEALQGYLTPEAALRIIAEHEKKLAGG